uniref:transmembrane protein 131 homolog n=1 Tax=Erigeron canadensis TaxID=72917 RepID=UPI001CB8CBDB|nr:transmembrane protein 131 homolog [Erigeron canadensis]
MFYHRGFCHDVEALHFKVIMLCVVFYLLIFGPCTMTGTLNPTGYGEYGYDGIDSSLGSDNVLVDDSRKRNLSPDVKLENICRRSDLFCFPSTLSGVKADDTVIGTGDIRSSNHGNFQLINGNVVSCSLEVKESNQDTFDSSNENDTPFVRIKSSIVNDFSSVDIQISHSLLDWGRKYLHVPSLTSLTVENRHKSRVLNVYEPYSTNKQFYPCNYSEFKLGPGEVASICFVFLPKNLGLSSGHLILQTSSGGFLVRAQGFGVEPPYMIQSSVGSGPRVVSVFNPSDKVLHLEEVSAWISFSSGNVSYLVSGVCSVMDYMSSSDFDVNEWLDVKISQVGQPVMAVRPQKTWSIGSNSIQPILELDFPYNFQATIYGSFCIHILNNDLRDSSCTSILEANLGSKSRSYTSETHLSVSLNLVMPTDANEIASVSLLVKNDGPDLVTVVNISAVGDHAMFLETKYVEGLILFPHTLTQVAMVTYTSNPFMNLNCSLLVQTNKSSAPALEVYCNDIASLCSRLHSYAGYGELKNDNAAETGLSNDHLPPQLEIKAKEMTTADESVLRNWISQGTSDAMSVLIDHEVMFSMVHIGTHQSKWISVVNPSDQPVVMQLLLNSGEIINECHGSEEILQPSSSYYLVLNDHMNPLRFGYSIPQNAVTEAYVHPHEEAVLGPIVFHPSSRCAWKSSALVRNNLSGVEWLSLRGSGGLVSLMLLDGADPVHTIELKHNYGQPSMKVLLAKNTGDLPVKVNGITISGTKCELDGFAVGHCKGFSLQPGESRKLMISYRADICAEMVRRELELAMAGGILVIPMEVSLPTPTVTICRRSLFWTRFKKLILAALVLLLPVFLVCSCSFSFIIRGGNLPNAHSSDACLKPKTMKVVVASPPPVPLPSQLSSSMVDEVSRPKNLTVKTGKENARLRKKKRNSGLGLTGQYEVSSSHSSTSTPSSPLSPASSSTPKRSPQLSPSQNIRSRNMFNHSTANAVLAPKDKSYTPPKDKPSTPPKHKPSTPPKHKPSTPHKDKPRTPFIDKPRTPPIRTPPTDKLCTTPIDKPCKPPKTTAPFALAPGANRKNVKHGKNSGNGDRFEYKVWGQHLQLRCPGSFEVQDSCIPTIAEDNHFSSFFAMTPQEFFKTSQAEIVSLKENDQSKLPT